MLNILNNNSCTPISVGAFACLFYRDIIKRIGKEKTIIFSTHILSEALATCDRVVIINNGKLAADYTMDKLQGLLEKESIEDLFRRITKGNHS